MREQGSECTAHFFSVTVVSLFQFEAKSKSEGTMGNGKSRSLCCVFLASALAAPLAWAQQGEQGLFWRDGDPFVFCRYGLDQTPKAWFPIPNYATTPPAITPGYCPWPLPSCPYPLTALKGWSQTEIQSYFAYLRICPQAEDSGRWDGPGDGTTTPGKH